MDLLETLDIAQATDHFIQAQPVNDLSEANSVSLHINNEVLRK